MQDTFESKVVGCLAAGAIGDTLGRPTEGWDYQRIVETYGIIDDPFPDKAAAEIGTDDTALALILCRAYLAKGGRVGPEDYADAWLEQMEPRHYWYCMANSYELLRAGHSARTTGALNIVTGSGLMSVNPIAIYNAGAPERAYHDALELTSMFQRGLSVYVAGVTAAGIAEALRPGATVDSVIDAALAVAPAEPIQTYNRRDPDNLRDALAEAVQLGRRYADPLEMRAEAYDTLLQYQSFDCQETMLLLYAVFAAARGETRAGIVGGANIGRDTDTIASLVGQLTGALNGLDSLPEDWLQVFLCLPGGRDLVAIGREMAGLVRKRAKRDTATAEAVLMAAGKGGES